MEAIQLKAARIWADMSQSDLAEASGLSVPTIQRMENPKIGPGRSSADNVNDVLSALNRKGISIDPFPNDRGMTIRKGLTPTTGKDQANG